MRSEAAGRPLVPLVLLLVAALLLVAGRAGPRAAARRWCSGWSRCSGCGCAAASPRCRDGDRPRADEPARSQRRRWWRSARWSPTVVVGMSSGADRLVLRGAAPGVRRGRAAHSARRLPRLHAARPPPDGNVFRKKLLTVRGAPAGTRIRFAALDTYDGTHWAADNDTDPERVDDRFLRLSSTIDNPADGDRGRDRGHPGRGLGAALGADRRQPPGPRLPGRGPGRRQGGPALRPRHPDRGHHRRARRRATTT